MNIIISKNISNKKNKDTIILIPKKYVKKANKRNKIRRQIKAIFRELKIKNIFLKYLDYNEKPNFQEIKFNILENLR